MRSADQRVSFVVLAAVAALGFPSGALAYSGGIGSSELGSGCGGCHSGGPGTTSATIGFSSPIVSGVTNTVTVTVTNASQNRAGFNLQLGNGNFALSPGAGVARLSGTEVTHSTPDTTVPYSWTIAWVPGPADAVASYTLWVNAVDGNGSTTGDTPRASAVTGSVTIRRPQGSTCSTGTQCGTGFCTDGVCCNTACNGVCQACSPAAGGQAAAGTCSSLVAGSLECCPAGYRWNGSSCILEDPCVANVDDCVAIASCVDVPGSNPAYTCVCPHAGYQGDGRSPGTGCTNINECSPNPCAPFGSCTERSLASWSVPGYDCACDPGYGSNGTTCVLQNECTAGTADCHPLASCFDPSAAPGDFICTCPSGYVGTGRGAGGCTDVDECLLGLDDCDANATCTNTPGSFTCACNSGYSGTGRVCNDVNECLDPVFLAQCDVNSTCANLPGTFECNCNPGWTGDGLVSCTDVDECAAGTDDCDGNATCTNNPGSWSCACNAGWDGDGRTCVDVDECLDSGNRDRCSTVATCVNEPGSWRCQCGEGFRGDGFTCEDIDECAEGVDECDVNATCMNELGTYTCICNAPGWQGSGIFCQDVDECALGTSGCGVNELCVNNPGARNDCVCAPGYSRERADDPCRVRCGDGARGLGEQCDDGNLEAGDGCDALCDVEPGWACYEPTGEASDCQRTCGDGLVQVAEECDDSERNSDTAPDACRTNCRRASCGDGVTDSGEQCDDGPRNSDEGVDGCRRTCVRAYCGDGVVDTGELCDPGGGLPGAAIAGTCTTRCLPDAGVSPADPPRLVGGACHASGGGGQSFGLLLAALALVWAVRRRRR